MLTLFTENVVRWFLSCPHSFCRFSVSALPLCLSNNGYLHYIISFPSMCHLIDHKNARDMALCDSYY